MSASGDGPHAGQVTHAEVVPVGWSHNPSAWRLRLTLVALASSGAVLAGYLTLVQVGTLATAWDPVFGSGSERVLHSSFSNALPVPDSGVGAVAYLAEIALAVLGTVDRWHRTPWLPMVFEALVLGTAAAGFGLVLLQVMVIHHFCLLCIVSATISAAILALSRGREGRAAWQQVRRQHAAGTGWLDALVGRDLDEPALPGRRIEIATARAATAATLTLVAALGLFLLSIGFYVPAGAGQDLVGRDMALATLLGLFGLPNMLAPLRARRSAIVVLTIGILLLGLAGIDGARSTPPLVFWADATTGLVAVLCASTTVAMSEWSRHRISTTPRTAPAESSKADPDAYTTKEMADGRHHRVS